MLRATQSASAKSALGRGGDQVAIRTKDGYDYIGGVSKSAEKRTKVKSRVVGSALSELIKSSSNVVIMGHSFTDLDAIGAAAGMACAVESFGIPVYIATDKPLHTKHTLMALEAGKHVLSEIPCIETFEEAKILRDAVKAHPELKYMAGENCFYWAFIEAWKKMREDGKFGDILYAESEYLHAPHPDDITYYSPIILPVYFTSKTRFCQDFFNYIPSDIESLPKNP